MGLTRLAIKNATTVFIMIFIVFVVGIQSYISLPREGSPDIQIPIIIVSTPYFGVSAKDIETLVTIPMEKRLKELSDVKEITSTSAESASAIVIEFEPNVVIDTALQKVRDKVDLGKMDIPTDAEDPMVIEINTSDFPIMYINIAGEVGLTDLKQIGEDIQDEIEAIRGVLQVDLIGGLQREINVIVDAERLDYYKLSFNAVIGALQAQNINVPGGSIEVGDVKYLVRVPGEFETIEEIEGIVLKSPGGHPVYLRDVAQVIDGYEEQTTFASIDGRESITLSVQKRSGDNLMRIAKNIKDLIADKEKRYSQLSFIITSDQSEFIEDILTDLQNNMITSVLLVFVILFFFLGLRNATFVAVAIPLVMMITFATLQALGITLNFIVLFAIIVALGLLIDNSIVIVEGAYRLMQNGMPRAEASLQAAKELGVPLLSATLTTLAAFAPLLFWPGIIGEFMGYFPKLLIIALAASLFVAMFVNPVFTAQMMKARKKDQQPDVQVKPNPLLYAYMWVLTRAVRWRYLTVGLVVGAFILTLVVYGQLGKGVIFFSEEEPSVASINIRTPEGSRVGLTKDITEQVEMIANTYAEGNVKHIISNVGSPGQSESSMGGGGGSVGGAYSHIGSVTLDFEDVNLRKRRPSEILADIRTDLKALAGAEFEVVEQSNGPPAGAPVSVELIGDNLEELARLKEEVKKVMEGVPGVVDLRDNFNLTKPELIVDVDRSKASLLDLNPQIIGMAIRTAINGTEASKFRELDEEYNINVRLGADHRAALDDVARLNIANNQGEPIPLSMVARVETQNGAGAIRRKDSQRTVTIESNAQGRLASAVVLDVQKALEAQVSLPPGYSLRYGGEQEESQEAAAFLGRAFLLVMMLIFLILVTQFNSFILPVIILSTVVLAIMGALIGQMISGTPFSIVLSGLGVISLAAIVINNGIILIDYIEALKKQGYTSEEAVIRAGMVRLRPVLLTAGTTILSLSPSIFGFSIDFTNLSIGPTGETSQMFFPLSLAIVSGLFVSTVLTLVFVPAIYMIIDNIREFSGRIGQKLLNKISRKPEEALNLAPSITGLASDGPSVLDAQLTLSAYEALLLEKRHQQQRAALHADSEGGEP